MFAVCLDVDDVLRFGQPCESIKQIAIVQHEYQKQVFILFLPVLSRSHFFGVEGRDGAAAAVHARHKVRTCGIDLGDIKTASLFIVVAFLNCFFTGITKVSMRYKISNRT